VLQISDRCRTSCSACEPILSCACPAPERIKAEGKTITWTGGGFETSDCLGGNKKEDGGIWEDAGVSMPCLKDQVCVRAGRYVASMCALHNDSDAQACPAPFASYTCVDVPFDYPGDSLVEGVLPP
jgi:hypothetical protein